MRPASWLLRLGHDLGVSEDVRSVGWLLWHFLTHHYTRLTLAWVAALALAGFELYFYYTSFDDPTRRDGNFGHATIDFGGQYLMGRLLLSGHGPDLFNRIAYWQAAYAAYPPEDAAPPLTPEQQTAGVDPASIPGDHRDCDSIIPCYMTDDAYKPWEQQVELQCVMALSAAATPVGTTDPLAAVVLTGAARPEITEHRIELMTAKHLGGPLYPPVNAFLYAPLALLKPHAAYHTMQVVLFGFALLAAYGICLLTDNRVWWPVAFALLILYPGFRGSDQLAQNAPISFAIAVWGWVLAARGRPGWGGVVWGLFAFKPVWALSFIMIPLLTGRWKMCLTMCLTGAAIVAATLPFVGLNCWFDWLKVGHIANALYNVDQNWTFLSRDLLSIPRRMMIDFDLPDLERDKLSATLAGWAIYLFVVEMTVLLAVRRRDQFRDPISPVYAFLFLGAALCCYHFMYYDIMLTGVGVMLLLARPRRLVEPVVLTASSASGPGPAALPDWREYARPRLPHVHPLLGHYPAGGAWVRNSFLLTMLLLLLMVEHLFGWLSLTASVAGPHMPMVSRTGTTILATPQLETLVLTTNLYGPPWDTLLLLILWAYAGVLTLWAPRIEKG